MPWVDAIKDEAYSAENDYADEFPTFISDGGYWYGDFYITQGNWKITRADNPDLFATGRMSISFAERVAQEYEFPGYHVVWIGGDILEISVASIGDFTVTIPPEVNIIVILARTREPDPGPAVPLPLILSVRYFTEQSEFWTNKVRTTEVI